MADVITTPNGSEWTTNNHTWHADNAPVLQAINAEGLAVLNQLGSDARNITDSIGAVSRQMGTETLTLSGQNSAGFQSVMSQAASDTLATVAAIDRAQVQAALQSGQESKHVSQEAEETRERVSNSSQHLDGAIHALSRQAASEAFGGLKNMDDRFFAQMKNQDDRFMSLVREGYGQTEKVLGAVNAGSRDTERTVQTVRQEVENLLIAGFKDGRYDAATNTAALQLTAATNTAAIQAALCECCCEIREKISADGEKTRGLINEVSRLESVRRELKQEAEIMYLKGRLPPGVAA